MSLKSLMPLHLGPSGISVLDFTLPPELEASQPPEARGLARDDVRLMVSYRSDNRIQHVTFRELPNLLTPGDLLVINTSGTMNAALNVTRADGTALELHLSHFSTSSRVKRCVCRVAQKRHCLSPILRIEAFQRKGRNVCGLPH